jgi:hypothetical protein
VEMKDVWKIWIKIEGSVTFVNDEASGSNP